MEFLFLLELLHLLDQDLSLAFLLLPEPQSVNLSGLDLLNDHFLTLQSFFFSPFLDLLQLLDLFKPFDLHQLILFLLLNLIEIPIPALFLQLLLSDSCRLGISHHFIHLLDIIQLFVCSLNSSSLDGALILLFLLLGLTGWQILFLFLLKSQHLLFLGLRQSQLVLLLFFSHLLLKSLFLFGRFSNSFLHGGESYLHAGEVFLLEDAELAVVVIFLFDHLGHLLEFFLVAVGHVGADACIERTVPKRLSSISGRLAMYFALRDLLLMGSSAF